LLNAKGVIWESRTKPNDLRSSESEFISIEDGDYVSVYDLRSNTRLQSGLGMCTTFFVCFILATGAMLFSKEANELVIAPIE